jgi:hypothetical protein
MGLSTRGLEQLEHAGADLGPAEIGQTIGQPRQVEGHQRVNVDA